MSGEVNIWAKTPNIFTCGHKMGRGHQSQECVYCIASCQKTMWKDQTLSLHALTICILTLEWYRED